MPNRLPEFSPACTIPYILHPEERVKQLQAVLDTEFGQLQRVNIEALIHLYEIGDLGPRQRTDPPVFMVDGVRVERDLIDQNLVLPILTAGSLPKHGRWLGSN
jgi:hypothetical protein